MYFANVDINSHIFKIEKSYNVHTITIIISQAYDLMKKMFTLFFINLY